MPITAAFANNTPLNASSLNALPWGLVTVTVGGTNNLSYRSTLSNTTFTAGAGGDIANSSMTFTGISGRLYRYSIGGNAGSTLTTGWATLDIYDGASVVQKSYINMANSGGAGQFYAAYVFTSSTSKTIKAQIYSNVGQTTVGSSNNWGFVLLEDIGPST